MVKSSKCISEQVDILNVSTVFGSYLVLQLEVTSSALAAILVSVLLSLIACPHLVGLLLAGAGC